ncbi:hypothetical protein CsSME_00032382 [Camellia sinensis var. sinensis]
MGKYQFMVSCPGAMAEFRREFNIPDDVHIELAKEGETPWCKLNFYPFTVIPLWKVAYAFRSNPWSVNF